MPVLAWRKQCYIYYNIITNNLSNSIVSANMKSAVLLLFLLFHILYSICHNSSKCSIAKYWMPISVWLNLMDSGLYELRQASLFCQIIKYFARYIWLEGIPKQSGRIHDPTEYCNASRGTQKQTAKRHRAKPKKNEYTFNNLFWKILGCCRLFIHSNSEYVTPMFGLNLASISQTFICIALFLFSGYTSLFFALACSLWLMAVLAMLVLVLS